VFVGFLPFIIPAVPHANIALISWADWPGFVKGVELSVLDLLAAAIYLSLPRVRSALPFRGSMILYFLAVVISAFPALIPFAAVQYAWQLARVYFVFVVVARGCINDRVIISVLTGMVIGLCGEAVIVMAQRVGFGELQATGTFIHQNTLGLASHFVVFPLFALLLSSKRIWQAWLAPFAGVIIAVMTASRATIGLAAAGYIGLFCLSALRKWTARKGIVAAAGLILAIGFTPVIIASFEKRFSLNPETDYDERAAFALAASNISSDFPLGVGANNYVVVANAKGYLDRAGVAPTFGSRSAHVHNAYLLSLAELGWIGGVAFALLLVQPMLKAFVIGWRNRGSPRGDLLLGLGMSLLVVSIHNFFEWIFVTYYIEYIFAISVGMIAGLIQQANFTGKDKA
jgi:O-antigen ligase